ncbi:hypothetical protein [Ornithinibacillus sp. JPR2-1]|uniref:hypothetical protein n=1 Tax=Ornithinibacillus sp. JPR2-1 TaxID=2094019 RepID=UPI0031D183A9
MADTTGSSSVNKRVLVENLGLQQLSNTTIFKKGNYFVLSPSVQNNYRWFDLRKKNLNRYNREVYKGYLLIRYLDTFLLTNLNNFADRMLPLDKYVITKSIGIHWKFNIERIDGKYLIVNRQNKDLTYEIEEVSVEELQKTLI